MPQNYKENGFSTLLCVDPTPRLRSVRAARAALLKIIETQLKSLKINEIAWNNDENQ